MTQPGEPSTPDDRRARLRAADADRELVHEILSAAMAHGSLSPTEYEERAGKAVLAKTFGDLDLLTDDLPVAQLGVAMPAASLSPGPRVTGGSGDVAVRHRLAIMSGSELSGTAVVADQLTATAIMGGVELDLREVEFIAPVLTLQCMAIMGGVEIKVPDGVTVEIGGLGIMGGFSGRSQKASRPGAPVVRVTGLALMGGVDVKHVSRDEPDV
ncbi:DUF1707 domain-containing protein [Gordonia sp. KTR9]|uniref:DUF1707 domain-containing protein n=1 Tax=Gordonia sp. KTR9 TaxID=337191 RepID=UPI00027DD93C|nr:DUF1707 domain-containing protein [Gordonia sp. KTR9]AFR47935.1 conserved hypothetical protein, DUF1707 superfamily [Gordonia sp. KTR9]